MPPNDIDHNDGLDLLENGLIVLLNRSINTGRRAIQIMARWKKPNKDETLNNRRSLAERARSGQLPLPDAVAELRKGIVLTQIEFAAVIGITRRQVADIERGTANPTLQTLQKIARLFGFDVGFMAKATKESRL